MMTALFMLDALRGHGGRFSGMSDGFIRYPQVLVNVHVKEKKPFDDVAEIAGELKDRRSTCREGRLLLRYSGTENLARVMIEGKDQTRIEGASERPRDVIRSFAWLV
jgi:phosphoglucosamine mutase